MSENKHRKTLGKMQENIEPTDTFADAIRKALIANLTEMLDHQEGAILGEDIEAIHKMRVATRRMRSLIWLDKSIFKSKSLKPHKLALKQLAGKLGAVRDIDVQLQNLQRYMEAQEENALSATISTMQKQRKSAHKSLVKYLQSKDYRRLIKQFTQFLKPESRGFKVINPETPQPHQVRHVLPTLIHEYLAKVRAYDTIIGNDEAPLHTLRIECKRLRYLLTAFESVLGSSAGEFIEQLKKLQEHLGEINDAHVSQDYFRSLLKADDFESETATAIAQYLDHVIRYQQQLVSTFEAEWEKFNTRTVQKRLSDALLVLR